jgi:hypothetical protein
MKPLLSTCRPKRYPEALSFSIPFLKSISAMAAATAAAITPGYMIKFRKHTVDILFIIMNAFNELSARTGKGIFLFHGNQLIQAQQAVVAQTAIKCFAQENPGFVADRNLRTGAGADILPVAGK